MTQKGVAAMKIRPALNEVKTIAAAGGYKVLPVSGEILSDICTPIEALKILKNVSTHCYLLGKRRAAFIPFSALCSYFIFGVSFRCRVELRYSSSVWLTTELAVLENASPNVRQQAGSSGRDTTPGQPNACITSSCEMVTPSPLRTNAMMRVSSRKL